jgi:hypothetical protein
VLGLGLIVVGKGVYPLIKAVTGLLSMGLLGTFFSKNTPDIPGTVNDFSSTSYVIFKDKPLKADGRIGKNTRLVLATFVKDMKERLEGTGKYAASSSTFNTESASKVKSSEVTSSKPVSVNGISAKSSDNQA